MKVYNRSDIVSFMKIEENYIRMQGFTNLGKTANSKTYSRQYVDEDFEREDVTGYSPEIAYGFDRIIDNKVHDKMAEIHDEELKGETVEILTVDFNKESGNGYKARLRTHSVIPDGDGDGTDAYTYSGKFKKSSIYTKGIATVSEDGLTANFTPDNTSEASAQSEEETGTEE